MIQYNPNDLGFGVGYPAVKGSLSDMNEGIFQLWALEIQEYLPLFTR